MIFVKFTKILILLRRGLSRSLYGENFGKLRKLSLINRFLLLALIKNMKNQVKILLIRKISQGEENHGNLFYGTHLRHLFFVIALVIAIKLNHSTFFN